MKFIRETFLFWGCLFCLILFYIKNLHSLIIPSICFDEIGYWANAAFWDGQNWSGVMGNLSPYYSYGYSIILFLLMKVFKNLEMLHQSAIVVNIFMVLIGYCIINYLAKWMFPKVSKNMRYVVCIIPFFYPSIQFHTQTAWGETYLCLLFLVSILLIKKLYESEKTVFYFLFGLILVNLYITHQRNIAIVILGILHLLFLSILKKNRWRQFIIFISIMIIFMAGSAFVKKSLHENVYTDTTITEEVNNNELNELMNKNNYNDYSGQIEKIQYLFTREGVSNFIISYAGKIYYFMLASLFLGGVGIWHMAQEVIKIIKLKKYDEGYLFVYCYILTSFLGTLVVGALFMIYPYRIDTVAYGRYTDCLVPILITAGIFKLIISDGKESNKIILGQILFCFIFLLIFEKYIIKYHIVGFYTSCSQIMGYFNQLDKDNMLKLMTLIIAIFGVIVIIFSYIKKKNYKSMMISVFLLVIWIIISNQSVIDLISAQHKDVVYAVAKYIEKTPERDVYYLYNDESCRTSNIYTGSIQYLIQDRILYCITDIESVKENDSLVIICEKLPIPDGYNIEYETRFYKVISKEEL